LIDQKQMNHQIESRKIFSFTYISFMITLNINQKTYQVDADPNMPLLWAIRDIVGLTGTKYGCGVAQCGACTVHLNGEAVRSCVTRVKRAEGQKITTIEGLSKNNDHPLQLAWQKIDVPQCGYCQSGQLMSAAVLLRENPNPTDEDIDNAMAGNICRCGTYLRIRKAIHLAAQMQKKEVKNG
jgi:isoquinoline 1-oxidoreductase alpha subunit